jgi:antitoxin component of MazEF toxin-antitoxin module
MEHNHTRQVRTTNGETEIEIPDPLADELGFEAGDDVEISTDGERIVVTQAE